jgi:AraC-like DNA-binding protein
MRDSTAGHFPAFPSAGGVLTRLACARAMEAGIEVDPLLRKADLTREQIENPNARLNARDQVRFVELVATALQDDMFGFHLAQSYDLRVIGLLYYVLASADNLTDALHRAARYSAIVNEGIAVTLRDERELSIAFDYVGVARSSDRHQIEFWMTTVVRICRQLTGRRLPASRVTLMHPRSIVAPDFNAFFGGDVLFGAAADELVFSQSAKDMAVVSADSYLHELLIKYCDEALASRTTGCSSFGVSVENAIATLLPHGKARAGEVARKLGLSQRTLARRLSAEGLTFAGVLQSLRSDLAKRYLTDETLPISNIAWLLGYQDVSAFTHAYKRWTGTTPRVARQTAR